MMSRNNNPGKPTKTTARAVMVILLLLVGSWVQAAQISVKTDHSPVAVDETFQLIFTVDGEPDGSPDFSPLEQDFEVLGTSQSRNISIVNGKASRTTRYLVNVLPRRSGELTVPSVSFGKDVSPVLKLRVQDATTGKTPAAASGEAVFMEVDVDQNKPWVQQQVILTVRIFSRIQWKEASLSDPQFRGGEVLVQKLGEDRRHEKQRDGQSWQVIERRYALFPQKSGELSMDPLSLNLRIPAGRKKQRSPFGSFNDPFFDDFFSSRSYRNKMVRSKPLSLDVRPIPPAFHGKRWLVARDLQLQESWSDAPEDLKTGEPVARTLAIVADGVTLGQLPELALPQIQGLRIYPDDPVNKEQATDKGILSTSSRKFAIIPTHPGDYQLPAVELKWWNSVTGREQTARLAPRTLKVTGAVQNVPPPVAATPLAAAPVSSAEQPPKAPGNTVSPVDVAVTAKPGGGAINTWLIAGNVILASLWLLTLVLYVRSRKAAGSRVMPEEKTASVPDMSRLWRQLHQAAQAGDAAAVRASLLELAPGLWPEQTPRSLEAMADRVDAPLSVELLNLSRHLYADPAVAWDGEKIESGMKALRHGEAQKKPDAKEGVLKPLYPNAG